MHRAAALRHNGPVGVPGAPWLPFILLVPLLYGATVVAVSVEAARIASLVRRAVEQELL